MPIADWDKDQIKKLAQASGKPLEVQCAEAFLKAGWRVSLGTFYTDIASERIRELDALIEKSFTFVLPDASKTLNWTVTLRVLASCKGFPPDHGPATYSVSANSQTVQQPSFMCYAAEFRGGAFADAMSKRGADILLHRAGLWTARQVVGFDILRCEDISLRRKDQKGPPQFEYSRNGDRDLYEGLDSAIKAAAYWFQEDRRLRNQRVSARDCRIVMNVPLLVTSQPFWDVSIENGTTDEPILKSSGFHVSLYPPLEKDRQPEIVMSVLWQASKLDELTKHLDGVLEFLADEAKLGLVTH
jgi:hypothetical protein